MARFTVHRNRQGDQLWLDCQADRLQHIRTRFVVPLVSKNSIDAAVGAMHPEFLVDGMVVVMAPQLAGAVQTSELGKPVISLADEDHRIIHALDVLIGTA